MPVVITIPSEFNLRDLSAVFENGIGKLRLNVLNAGSRVSTQMIEDLKKTVATWNHEVTFSKANRKYIGSASGGNIIENNITVSGAWDIWQTVDEGGLVSGRGIYGWKPKTVPGIFYSGKGAGYWDESAKQLNQVEARSWSLLLTTRYSLIYQTELERAVEETLDQMDRNS